MEILSRHKDSDGNILGYTIKIENKTEFIDASTAIGLKSLITNAFLTQSGEYRAKKGYQIDTVVDYSKLCLHPKKPAIVQADNNLSNVDYYGKGCIEACRKIRRYALEGKLSFDDSQHKSNNGANIHLYRLIEACGVDLKTFIINYLSTLQPYSLEYFQNNRIEQQIWLVDLGYKIRLVIKVDDSKFNKQAPIVISFHESNKGEKFIAGKKRFDDKQCAVIVDNVTKLPNGFHTTYTIQRGFIRYTANSATTMYYKGIALVDYMDIDKTYSSIMELLIKNIWNVYTDKVMDIPSFVKGIETENISFLSSGFATINNISLLLDLYNRFNDNKSRSVLVHVTCNMVDEMTDTKKLELKTALSYTFGKDKNNKLLGIINQML